MEQQILGWIPADTQFREHDKVCRVVIARLLGILDDLRRIARNITNDEVDLR